MKKHWKLMLSAFMLVFVLALTACGGSDDNGGNEQQQDVGTGEGPTETGPAAREPRVATREGLGGMQINIATWWEEGGTDDADPQSAPMRARWDDRQDMEELYDFTIRYVRYGSWHDVRDNIATELLAQNDDFQIWAMEGVWFATHHAQNLFAPIPLEHFNDPYGVNWNRSIIELTMRDGNPYGFAHGVEMGGGIYFNMRLFEEAGLPRDLPFQHQAAGTWTWYTFTDIARTLQASFDDGTGVFTAFPITTFNSDFLARALASNGASYAAVDPATGNFVNTTQSIEFLEAIQWVVSLRDEMLALHEDDVGGDWDVYRQMFNDGNGAMMSGGNYVAGGRVHGNLVDEWGFVHFPVGPRMTQPHSWVSANVNAIPHFYSQEEIADFMFALTLWIRPLEEDDPYDWIFENHANHVDPRSVNDTMVNFTRNPAMQSMPAQDMMPGLGQILGENFAWRVWSGNEPAVIVDEAQLVWQDFLNRINDM
jgi:hypothetical protein